MGNASEHRHVLVKPCLDQVRVSAEERQWIDADQGAGKDSDACLVLQQPSRRTCASVADNGPQ